MGVVAANGYSSCGPPPPPPWTGCCQSRAGAFYVVRARVRTSACRGVALPRGRVHREGATAAPHSRAATSVAGSAGDGGDPAGTYCDGTRYCTRGSYRRRSKKGGGQRDVAFAARLAPCSSTFECRCATWRRPANGPAGLRAGYDRSGRAKRRSDRLKGPTTDDRIGGTSGGMSIAWLTVPFTKSGQC